MLRLGLAQVNTRVGDRGGKVERIGCCIERACQAGVDLVAFPEMAVTGYPPEDLLLKPVFLRDARRCLDTLAGVYRKRRLPNYGVFDEERYFRAGWGEPDQGLYRLGETLFGVTICEDIWYPTGPVVEQAAAGAELILNINASPYHAGKRRGRERMLATRAADNSVIVAAVYLVGGQDELVFDGGSMVFDERGSLLARAALFEEDLLICDVNPESVFRSRLHDPRWRNLEHLAGAARGPDREWVPVVLPPPTAASEASTGTPLTPSRGGAAGSASPGRRGA